MKKNKLENTFEFIKESSDSLLTNNIELKKIFGKLPNKKDNNDDVTYTAGTLNAYMG
jgi:hypothetical protein